MAKLFHYKVVNDLFGDPVVFVRLLWKSRAFLFDIGDIRKLNFSELLKVTDVFVTHTHIDHFIGFDQLLRAILRRDKPLRVFGPENIIECVEGKLKSYTWNLVSDYPLSIEVYAISERDIKKATFNAWENFRVKEFEVQKRYDEAILKESEFQVKAQILSHGIPVVAYCIEEEFHINIDKEALKNSGLSVGPWLGNLKTLIKKYYKYDPEKNLIQKEENQEKIKVETPAGAFTIEELFKILKIKKGEKISYVMDVTPTEDNIEKIINFVKNSDILFCEAYFLESDRNKALERNHLTTFDTGRIARQAAVKELIILHVSPKYINNPSKVYEEVELSKRGH